MAFVLSTIIAWKEDVFVFQDLFVIIRVSLRVLRLTNLDLNPKIRPSDSNRKQDLKKDFVADAADFLHLYPCRGGISNNKIPGEIRFLRSCVIGK